MRVPEARDRLPGRPHDGGLERACRHETNADLVAAVGAARHPFLGVFERVADLRGEGAARVAVLDQEAVAVVGGGDLHGGLLGGGRVGFRRRCGRRGRRA